MKITVKQNGKANRELFTVLETKQHGVAINDTVARQIATQFMRYTQQTKAVNAVKAAIRMIQVHHSHCVGLPGCTLWSGDKMNDVI